MPCTKKKKVCKTLFSREYFLSWRARLLCVCVFTSFTHMQVFGGIFARIFTHYNGHRFRHRAAASAIGGLCRGLRERNVSVLFHLISCEFDKLWMPEIGRLAKPPCLYGVESQNVTNHNRHNHQGKVTDLFCMANDFCKFFDAIMIKYAMVGSACSLFFYVTKAWSF